MKKEDFRIVFMGTPAFAVASMEAILKAGYPIVGVVTAMDKPAGRGKKLKMSEVKRYALEKNLKVLQPSNLKDPEFIHELQALQATIHVVVAFRMLPEVVWAMPPYGTINLHASLLPQYRGAAPIHHAIMNGETKTGLTTFLLQKEIDTGQILLQKELDIGFDENVGQIHDKMMILGADLLVETLDKIRTGKTNPIDQSKLVKHVEHLKPAPKIFKNDCRIDWNRDVIRLHHFIRGLSPYPAAFTHLRESDGNEVALKIFKAIPQETKELLPPGHFMTNNKDELEIFASNGKLRILEVQLAGRKRMSIRDFLRGHPLDEKSVFV